MKVINIKNKKNFLGIISLLLIVAVGTTFAIIYSSSTRDNEYDIARYSVVTMETFESPTNWLPGETIDKTIYLMNNGDIPVAFRVKYNERWEDGSGNDISSLVPEGAVTINFINKAHWKYNSEDGYYYHKYYIDASDSSCSLISGVTLNEDLMSSASCEMENDTYVCTSNLNGLSGAHYILTFTKEAVAYSKYQEFWNSDFVITEEQPLYILPEGRNVENLQVGDEICINGDTTECFNFYGYDGNNIKLLSKYNLKVGKIYDSSGTQTGIYSSSDTGYGLQSSEAKGYVPGQTRYGTVAFSQTNYWYDGSNLKSKYGSSYPADVYDTDYVTEPDFITTCDSTHCYKTPGYSIAYYVEEYKKVLEDYGVTLSEARLLTYSEATSSSIGCSGSSCSNNGFITNTSFWLGSAYSSDRLWRVNNGDYFSDYGYYSDNGFGVRPVIVLSKSEVNNNVDAANKYNPISLPSGRTKDNLQAGDEICINGDTTECFNFYGYDGNNVKLLSKYNLKVGKKLTSNGFSNGTYTSGVTGYGLQSSVAIGYVSGQARYGTAAFSQTYYWYDGSNLKSKYGSAWNTNNIYDTDYKTEPDFSSNEFSTTGYSIAYYVEEYKDKLENYGVTISEARLLTYSEAKSSSIGCSGSSCPDNGFIRNTSFWLGSARSRDYVFAVYSYGDFGAYTYSDANFFGVRPVIVIDKSNMQ